MFYFRGTRKPDFKNIKKIDYNQYWSQRGFVLRERLMPREKIFLSWVKNDSSVLDIGCGNSRLLYELKKQKDCQVKGIDASFWVIDSLKKIGIESEVRNIESPDFELSGRYDYIILSEVLEHLREPEDFISKIRPQTKYLLISIPNSAFYRYRLGLLLRGRFFTQWAFHPSEHLRYWSHRDFVDWIGAMDLKLLEAQPADGFKVGKKMFKNLFAHQICYLVECPSQL